MRIETLKVIKNLLEDGDVDGAIEFIDRHIENKKAIDKYIEDKFGEINK